MVTNEKDLPQFLREMRWSAKVSQDDMAELLGVDRKTINSWETEPDPTLTAYQAVRWVQFCQERQLSRLFIRVRGE